MQASSDKALNNSIQEWRCFHCDEVFTTPAAAEEHFGRFIWQEPVCHITAAKYREMELLNSQYRQEDTELHRQIHALQSQIAVETRQANERGYAQAIEAIKSHPEELQLQPISTAYKSLNADLLSMLYTLLPFIEDAEADPVYKKGHVSKLVKQIKALIDRTEGTCNAITT